MHRGVAGIEPAVFVMGNHELWNSDVKHGHNVARVPQSLGITPLDDREAEIVGLNFVGGTLWADGHLAGQEATPQRETGEQIKVVRADAMGLITSADEGALHARTRGVIEAAMARPRDGHLVVVTHHAPVPSVCSQLIAPGGRRAMRHLTCRS